jgi:hypothetical protein
VTNACAVQPRSVAVGDLNCDGKLDLAVAGVGLSVLLGNGDGTFAAQKAYGAGTFPTSVALGDVNGDGKLDVVGAALATGGKVGVLLNAPVCTP